MYGTSPYHRGGHRGAIESSTGTPSGGYRKSRIGSIGWRYGGEYIRFLGIKIKMTPTHPPTQHPAERGQIEEETKQQYIYNIKYITSYGGGLWCILVFSFGGISCRQHQPQQQSRVYNNNISLVGPKSWMNRRRRRCTTRYPRIKRDAPVL